MALAELPTELLLIICKQLDDESSINALSQTNRRLYSILNDFLYWECARHPLGLGPWLAVRHGSDAAVLKFIAYGADIDGCGVSMEAAIRMTLIDAQIISPDEKGVGGEDGKETRGLDEYYPRYSESSEGLGHYAHSNSDSEPIVLSRSDPDNEDDGEEEGTDDDEPVSRHLKCHLRSADR